ncbi:MAG: hypothetical protein KGL39_44970 [Patescibacteria group bacterium]|nr:hypothetical protein [Patescibacteria group bacterium]
MSLGDTIIHAVFGDTLIARLLTFLLDHRADLEAVASTSDTLAQQVKQVVADIQGAKQQADATGQDITPDQDAAFRQNLQDLMDKYGPTHGE